MEKEFLTITITLPSGSHFSCNGPKEDVLKLYREWLARQK